MAASCFESCLDSSVTGTFTAWCMPAEKPEACNTSSWASLSSDDGVKPCPSHSPDFLAFGRRLGGHDGGEGEGEGGSPFPPCAG